MKEHTPYHTLRCQFAEGRTQLMAATCQCVATITAATNATLKHIRPFTAKISGIIQTIQTVYPSCARRVVKISRFTSRSSLYLLSGIRNGFHIGFDRRHSCQRSTGNIAVCHTTLTTCGGLLKHRIVRRSHRHPKCSSQQVWIPDKGRLIL